jgi:hypothetical protein
MFGPKGPACQSCGMPLSKDALGGGTNADGSRSREYCSHCYREGAFTQPNITAAEMTTLVEGKLRSMHFPGFLARRFAKEVPTLGRWRNQGVRAGAQQDGAREMRAG